jgi:uncharacterized membrane protein YuzA (DUF378 family)
MTNLPISPFDNPLVRTIEGVRETKIARIVLGIVALALAAILAYHFFFKKEKPKDKPLGA